MLKDILDIFANVFCDLLNVVILAIGCHFMEPELEDLTAYHFLLIVIAVLLLGVRRGQRTKKEK